MNVVSRFLVIAAGLVAAIWLRGGADLVSEVGLPFLALLAAVLAIIVATGDRRTDARTGLVDAYGSWLNAWQAARSLSVAKFSSENEELAAATRSLALLAPDRIVKALLAAERSGFATGAVAHLIIEMRRSLGHPSLTLRPAELERLLGEPAGSAPATEPTRPEPTHTGPADLVPAAPTAPTAPTAAPPNAPASTESVSFLS